MRRVTSTVSILFALSFLAPVLAVAAEGSASEPLQPVYFQTIKIDGFWKDQFKRLTKRWIPHCIKQMEEGGEGQELLNLVNAAKALKGEPHGEYIGRLDLHDGAVYNTIESICLALAVDAGGDADLAKAQSSLRAKLDEWIPIVLAAQVEDGYIDSYHILKKIPRYRDRDAPGSSQFYVQAYFIEMGVAHYRITGGADRRLYDAARLCADHLCETFGPPPKRVWIHSHPGMAYALCRLARLVNEAESPGDGDKYIQLAKFLLDTRHTVEKYRAEYGQSHLPVVEMTEAVGHSVRLTYFCTGVADLAMLTHDEGYRFAVDRIWGNTVHRKYYLTGGVGVLSSRQGEAFSADFDLPNDGYCEACAGCGMTFWADRMTRMHHDAGHIDVQERSLYNNILGAIELSGERFFYQNPLAGFYENPQGLETARYSWHECPCCVGNIPRALLGLKDLTYALDIGRSTLYVHHFVAGEGTIAEVAGTSLRISQKTDYPWSGDVKIVLSPAKPVEFTLKIRIPDRTESDLYTATPDLSDQFNVAINGTSQRLPVTDGYVTLRRKWQASDIVSLALPMDVQRIHCDDRVRANRGHVALIRGPITYNIESVDHDHDVRDLILPTDVPLKAVWKPELLGGVMAIEGLAATQSDDGRKPAKLFAVPNYARLNRGGRSLVWIRERPND